MYRVTKFRGSINKTPFMAKMCLRAPGVSRGGCWCDGSGYGSSLYLIQLKYIVWGKCKNFAEVQSIRIAVPAVLGMLWWSHSD